MIERLPAKQIAEWRVIYNQAPFGPAAEEFKTGTIAAAICNASGRFDKWINPGDFFKSARPTKKQTREQLRAKLEVAMLAFGWDGKKT